MIADRYVFVVRQQRVVRAEQVAGVGGVVDAGEEVGVVADGGRKLETAIDGVVNETGAQRFDLPTVRAVGVEDLAEPAAQRKPCVAAERE